MDKSDIIPALFELGFKIEELGEQEIAFRFEGLGYLYSYEDEDMEFFQISAPNIYQIEEEESCPLVLEIINEVNCKHKYTKTLLIEDSVWVSFEARLFEGMDAEEFVRYAILTIRASVELFFRKLYGNEEPSPQDND